MIRVLGIDPGTHHSGWALLEATSPLQARWVEAGEVECVFEPSDALLTRLRPDLVIVEEPRWANMPKIASELMVTDKFAGGWVWLAKARGIHAEEIYAAEWRMCITGKANPDDANIRQNLPRFVSGIPKVTNKHERDAAGTAYFGLRLPAQWTEMRRRGAEHRTKIAGLKAAHRKAAKAKAAAGGP